MNDFQEPPRLFELPDTPEALKSGLEEASRDALGAESVGRIADGVVQSVGAGAGAPGSGGAVGAGGSGALAKVLAGVAGAGLVAGVAWLAMRDEPRSEPVMTSSAPSMVVETADTSQQSLRELPADSVEIPPTPPEIKTAPKSKPAASPAAKKGDSLAEEHRLLRAARGALPKDPARALALAREHERKFPQGILAQEREVIAIQALAAMGRGDDAREKADGFDEAYPGSPHRNPVNEATGAEQKKDSTVP